jgi:uncharacterized protein YukE
MADGDFPALGFDPAMGNVTSVRELAQQMADTATYAYEAGDVLTRIKNNQDVWTGEAAKAFAGTLGELPKYLDEANKSLKEAGTALSTWGDRLEAHRHKARELENAAQQAQRDFKSWEDAANQADAAQACSDDPALYNDYVQKARGATAAWDRLEGLRKEASDLKDTWEDDGRRCAEALNEAAEKAPDKAFFESFGELFDDAGKWFADHLGDIGDIAGMVSAVAGVLAFIPILAPIAGPVALIAGGIALVAHGADMVVNEKWDDPNAWVSLAGDVAGLVPGLGPIAKEFGPAVKVVKGADKVVDAARGLTDVAITAGRGVAAKAAEVATPASMYQWAAEVVIGGSRYANPVVDAAATGMQITTNLGVQVPVVVGLVEKSESNDTTKNVSGVGAAIISGLQIVTRW